MKKSFVTLVLALALTAPALAPDAGAAGLKALSTVAVPLPANLGDFIADKAAAIRLGKALFWDSQVGGDGRTACATCHFQAGSDVRITNTVHPGKNGIFNVVGPGSTLMAADFPNNTDDIIGSQGVIHANFLNLTGTAVDDALVVPDPVFTLNGVNQRQVTGRNAPSVINAIFYFRNFWDGRANNIFNGVNPFGPQDNAAFVYKVVNGSPIWSSIQLGNSSLASQAVGPANNAVEMSFAGRNFSQLGRKLLGLTPLAQQAVSTTDSVLGAISAGNGLNTTYAAMIQQAFDPRWWDFNGLVNNDFNIMEANFSLYWGISVMLYESTLVSDQTPLDQFLLGNKRALTARQKLGMKVYTGKGRCNKCHGGAELSEATVGQARGNPLAGFVNTAVRPVEEDGGDVLQPGQAKFKTNALRNVELNGPYFHNGGVGTLRQVVDFYNRGGDFRSEFTDGDVRPLKLKEAEKAALVDFMIALTDERVRWERAPFDHPALDLPNGAQLPAVGAAGLTVEQGPLGTFLDLDQFQR